MEEEHNIQFLSQLLRLNFTSRSSGDVSKYFWTKYFNKDCTFSPYKFKKYLDTNLTNKEVYTARNLRNELLCSMIKLHNSLYKESSDYKGMSKCSIYIFTEYFLMFLFIL